MPPTPIEELSAAVATYGQTSLEVMNTVRTFGDAFIPAFAEYLQTEPSSVVGVPPSGEWDPDSGDYRDEKYGFFRVGQLRVEAHTMGVAISIPNLKDDGRLWVRLLVEISVEGSDLVVGVGDAPVVRLPKDCGPGDMRRLCEAAYQTALSMFVDPVRRAQATASGRFGFQMGA